MPRIQIASLTASPHQIHNLFAGCISTNPDTFWDKYKDSMSEDILHGLHTMQQYLHFPPETYNVELVLIKNIGLFLSNVPLIHLGTA